MAIREILKMGDPRLLRVAAPVSDFDIARAAGAGGGHVRHHARRQRRRPGGAADRRGPATGDLRLRAQRALPRGAAGAADGAGQPGDRTRGRRLGRWLGRLPVGAGAARRGAALCAHPLPRLRCQGASRSNARSTASTRAWCSMNATT